MHIQTHPICSPPAPLASFKTSSRFAKMKKKETKKRTKQTCISILKKGEKLLLIKYSINSFRSFFLHNCRERAWAIKLCSKEIIAPATSCGEEGLATSPLISLALEHSLRQVSHKPPVSHVHASRSHVPELGCAPPARPIKLTRELCRALCQLALELSPYCRDQHPKVQSPRAPSLPNT